MFIYLFVFLVALLFYFVSPRSKSDFLLAGLFCYMAVFVGLGDMIGGYDRYIYGDSFDTIANNLRGIGKLQDSLYLVSGSEYGYFLWEVIVACFTPNRYIFILITTLLVYALYYRAFIKYMETYPLPCILFVGFLFFFTMTYLRAVIAVGILWQGVKYIWERKLLKFSLVLLLAYSFHSSAMIVLPLYFMPQKKLSKSVVLKMLAVSLLIGLTPIPVSLLSSAGEVSGKLDSGLSYASQDQGFRIEYVFEVLFIIWFIFKNYKYIKLDPKTLTFLNMSFILCCVLLVFMRFGQGGRFTWPFFLGIFYLLPTLALNNSGMKYKKPILIFVSFTLFYRLVVAWAPLNIPYKTFLVDGEPSGDGSVYQYYEYDVMYSKDKFYRPAFEPILLKK